VAESSVRTGALLTRMQQVSITPSFEIVPFLYNESNLGIPIQSLRCANFGAWNFSAWSRRSGWACSASRPTTIGRPRPPRRRERARRVLPLCMESFNESVWLYTSSGLLASGGGDVEAEARSRARPGVRAPSRDDAGRRQGRAQRADDPERQWRTMAGAGGKSDKVGSPW
jgi:hypothetical protein